MLVIKRIFPLFVLFLFSFLLPQQSCRSEASKNPLNNDPDSLLRMKFIFVGDIMGHGPQITAAYDATTKTYDYDHCFQYVKPILSEADYAVGNLELTLPGKPPYTGYPMFKTPDAIADALKGAGFDLLVTANNHSNDGGLIGVTHTIDVIKNLGLEQTGTFKDNEDRAARYPLIVKKPIGNNKFIKVAYLNYTYGTNGVPDHKPSMVNLIDTAQMRKDYNNARSTKPDIIIAIMHWGAEYQLTEGTEQQKHAQFLANMGVDLIIGAHPHVIQPIKMLTGKRPDGTSREVPVVYSLGNFISNQKQANTDIGLMFEIEFIKDTRNGKISVGTHNWIPVWRYISASPTKYYTIPASAIEDDEKNVLKIPAAQVALAKASLAALRKRFTNSASTERKIEIGDIKK